MQCVFLLLRDVQLQLQEILRGRMRNMDDTLSRYTAFLSHLIKRSLCITASLRTSEKKNANSHIWRTSTLKWRSELFSSDQYFICHFTVTRNMAYGHWCCFRIWSVRSYFTDFSIFIKIGFAPNLNVFVLLLLKSSDRPNIEASVCYEYDNNNNTGWIQRD